MKKYSKCPKSLLGGILATSRLRRLVVKILEQNYFFELFLNLQKIYYRLIWNEDNSGILSVNGIKTIISFPKLALIAHKRYIAALIKKPTIKGNVLNSLLYVSLLLNVLICL